MKEEEFNILENHLPSNNSYALYPDTNLFNIKLELPGDCYDILLYKNSGYLQTSDRGDFVTRRFEFEVSSTWFPLSVKMECIEKIYTPMKTW